MTRDRGVSLADLAARAAERDTLTLDGKPARGSGCRNVECRKGLTPGLVAIGSGEKGRPLFGEGGTGAKRLMRWAWVRCLACNAPDDARRAGAVFKRLQLSEEEIAQRASLATQRASYVPEEPRKSVGVRPSGGPQHSSTADAGRLAELLETNKKLSEQVAALTAQIAEQSKQSSEATLLMGRLSAQVAGLLEDNQTLRKQLENKDNS